MAAVGVREETENMKYGELTPEQMIEIWAREQHKGVEFQLDISNGSGDGTDPDAAVMRYVEATQGFDRARLALSWVFVYGNEPERFPLLAPGESLETAVLLRGAWAEYRDLKPYEICRSVIVDFVLALCDRIDSGSRPAIEDPDGPCCEADEVDAWMKERGWHRETNEQMEAARQSAVRCSTGEKGKTAGYRGDHGLRGGYGPRKPKEEAFDHAAYLAGSLGTTVSEIGIAPSSEGAMGIAAEVLKKAAEKPKDD